MSSVVIIPVEVVISADITIGGSVTNISVTECAAEARTNKDVDVSLAGIDISDTSVIPSGSSKVNGQLREADVTTATAVAIGPAVAVPDLPDIILSEIKGDAAGGIGGPATGSLGNVDISKLNVTAVSGANILPELADIDVSTISASVDHNAVFTAGFADILITPAEAYIISSIGATGGLIDISVMPATALVDVYKTFRALTYDVATNWKFAPNKYTWT